MESECCVEEGVPPTSEEADVELWDKGACSAEDDAGDSCDVAEVVQVYGEDGEGVENDGEHDLDPAPVVVGRFWVPEPRYAVGVEGYVGECEWDGATGERVCVDCACDVLHALVEASHVVVEAA